MKYQSTRNYSASVSSARAIAQGLCEDGGLFVPEEFPAVTSAGLSAMERESYEERAKKILSLYLTDFSKEEIETSVEGAYGGGKFSGGHPAPVYGCGGVSFLELWHGPTCAFKDMALQLLPHLLTRSLKKLDTDKEALVLVATSGDTGKAALEGFRDVGGTRILVFYPKNGVSPMQKRQMCTQEGTNVSVCAVDGNFDDAQTGVKRIFSDESIRKALAERGLMFSSANSINWGRLLPQIVYYFSAYCDLMSVGTVKNGEPVNFVVPTGNFGDILAAYYAKKMGLPVHRLICASNANNVLTDFIRTGAYDRNRRFYSTISPSMDILVSSNLERLLFDLTGRDGEKVGGWMKELSQSGKYRVDNNVAASVREQFYAGFCDDKATKEEIKSVFEASRYLIDPHTAVASAVYRRYREETGDKTPSVIVSTASPFKFSADVLEALEGAGPVPGDEFKAVDMLSHRTGATVPGPIESLKQKPVRFTQLCSRGDMNNIVLEASNIRE